MFYRLQKDLKKKKTKRTDSFSPEVKFPKSFVPFVKIVWVVLLGEDIKVKRACRKERNVSDLLTHQIRLRGLHMLSEQVSRNGVLYTQGPSKLMMAFR